MSRWIASLLAVLSIAPGAGAADAPDSEGFRMEIEESLGSAWDDLASVLGGTIACIVEKQPERCGIRDFAVAHLSESQLRARFRGELVVVSASGRPGAKDEIRVEFPRAGREVGVIYYRRENGALVPVSVTVAIP